MRRAQVACANGIGQLRLVQVGIAPHDGKDKLLPRGYWRQRDQPQWR